LSANANGNLLVWSMDDGQLTNSFPAHEGEATHIAFSPSDGTFVSAGADGFLRIWNANTLTKKWELKVATPSSDSNSRDVITSISWHIDRTILAVGIGTGRVSIIDTHAKKEIHRWQPHNNPVFDLLFSPDGDQLAIAGDRGVQQLDWQSGNTTFSGKPHHGVVNCIAYSPDGKVLASGGGTRRGSFPNQIDIYFDGGIQLTSIETGESVVNTNHNSPVLSDIGFAPDGSKIYTVNRLGVLSAWDTKTYQTINSTPKLGVGDIKIAVSPNSKFVCVAMKEQVFVYDANSLTRVSSFNVKYGDVKDLAFSPDGKKLAVGVSTGMIDIVDPETWKVEQQLKSDFGFVGQIAWSPSGHLLAVANWQGLSHLLDATTGQILARFHDHAGKIRGLVFSPDGRFLASSAQDMTFCLYEVATAKLLRREETDASMPSLAFSKDNRTLFTGDYVDRLRLWDIPTMSNYHSCIARGGAGAYAAAMSPNRDQLGVAHRDGTALIWDCKLLQQARPADKLSVIDDDAMEQLWGQLQSNNPAEATKAVWAFVLSKNRDDVARFIAGQLNKSNTKTSGAFIYSDGNQIQIARAIQTLEYIGTDSAQSALTELAAGENNLLVTRQAKDAISRFDTPVESPE